MVTTKIIARLIIILNGEIVGIKKKKKKKKAVSGGP